MPGSNILDKEIGRLVEPKIRPVVPGDVVSLQSGDKIPADMRLFRAKGLQVEEAAKEASEMVLADDSFASIANAVEEGRTVYDNLKKAILFILPTNGGEVSEQHC